MNKRGKTDRAIWVVFLLGFILFGLTGCSTWRYLVNWIPFWDSGEKRYVLTDKDIAQCLSSVRPYQNPDSLYMKACYYQARRKHKLAIEYFIKAIFSDPNYVKAYNGMGISYDALGDFTRAIEAYKKALKLNPDLDYVLNNMGYSCLLRGDLDNSVDAFRKAIALNHKVGRYHNNLGLAYAKKGQFDLAFAEFRLAEDEVRAHKNLAQLYGENGLNEEAERHLTKAMAMTSSPGNNNSGQNADIRRPGFMSDIDIEVSNGNGVNHMARRVANYLTKKEFKVTGLSNANHFNHQKTKIYYCTGYLHEAYRVAQQIPGYQNMEKVKQFEQSNIKIKVLIGKDLVPFNGLFIGMFTGIYRDA